MALLDGKVDNRTYSEAKLRTERNLDFVKKVSVKEDPALTALYPARGMANRVTVATNSGKSVAEEVDVPRGHPLNPMTRDELERKFLGLTAGKIPAARAKELLGTLWGLDSMKDLSRLFTLAKVARG